MSTPTLSAYVARFRDDLAARGSAARTIEEYGRSLQKLQNFLRSCPQWSDTLDVLTLENLRGFQHWLYHAPTPRGTTRSLSDQAKNLAAVRTFGRFLKKTGAWPRDLTAELDVPHVPRALPRAVLTRTQARQILEAVNTTSPLGYRDRTMLETLYATAIRSAELRALRTADVNLDDGLLRILHGKGGKDRIVPLSRIAAAMLETYLRTVRPALLGARRSEWLFVSCRGEPLDRASLNKILRGHARAAGEKDKPATAHVWRHTCATHLLQNNANLRHVQELLGHASLATTERYLRLSIADLQAAHRRFHPREQGS